MRNQRSFSAEFKRQVIEELISGESRPGQICRRHNISASLLYHWKKQYGLGRFNNEPTAEGALTDRIEKLERLVGRLTLENEFLLVPVRVQVQVKKGLQSSLIQHQRNGKSSANGSTSSAVSGGGAVS